MSKTTKKEKKATFCPLCAINDVISEMQPTPLYFQRRRNTYNGKVCPKCRYLALFLDQRIAITRTAQAVAVESYG